MRVVSSEIAYRNPWIAVREDSLVYDDGSTGLFGVVEKPDFALIVPVQDDGFWMVEQWRHPVGRRGWEFPQGSWAPGHRPAVTADHDAERLLMAQAELREETGLTARAWRKLGQLSPCAGLVAQQMHVFQASDLTAGPTDREPSEEGMEHAFVRRQEFLKMVADGRCTDSHSVAAYALLTLLESPGR